MAFSELEIYDEMRYNAVYLFFGLKYGFVVSDN